MQSESTPVTGPASAWLSSRREELNARFRAAKRRFAKLDAQHVLALNAELLPPLAGSGEPGTDELLSEIFDLIILHSGRGLLTLGPSPFRMLFSKTFPSLRALLLQRPRLLPAALSNAVENLGSNGAQFARGMLALAPQLQNAEQVQDAGAVLAWRLGEARLREHALKCASQLPHAATLIALGLDNWPPLAAPLAVASLSDNAWCHPRERIRAQTLQDVAAAPPEKILELLEKLAAPATLAFPMTPAPAMNLRLAGTCGEFAGFGGYFLDTPKLLYAGKLANRHRFWVRSGETNYRIDADICGWVCKPDAAADFPIQETVKSFASLKPRKSIEGEKPALIADGVFSSHGRFEKIAGLAGANSYSIAGETLAATLPDSFRIRVYTTVRPPL